jgi:hypothetical protein
VRVTGARAGTADYTVTIKDADDRALAVSNTATITIAGLSNAEPPTFTKQPTNATYTIDGTATALEAEADGSGTVTYQWYSATATDAVGIEIQGATGTSYTPPTNAVGITYYYVEATNTDNNVSGTKTATEKSAIVSVTVNPAPFDSDIILSPAVLNFSSPVGYASVSSRVTVTNNGAQLPITNGVDSGLRIVLSNTGNFTTDPTTTLSAISINAGTAGFDVRPMTGLGVGSYTTDITFTYEDGTPVSGVSLSVTFTVSAPLTDAQTPIITAQPVSGSYTQNAGANALAVAASVSDGGTLGYQWYSATGATAVGTAIPGATNASYTPPTGTAVTTYYYVRVTNTNINVNGEQTAYTESNHVAVTVTIAGGPITGDTGGVTGGVTTPLIEEVIEEEPAPLTDIADVRTPLAGFIADRIAYINGYEDGTVRPDGSVTRAEVSVMLFRLLSDADKNAPATSTFADVAAGKWYSQAVAYLADKGILTGYEDGSFKPDSPITRAEFAAIISRFDESEGTDLAAKFSDVSGSHWAFAFIGNAADKGWMSGYPDGTFKPQNAITRAEAVTAINNMLVRDLSSADIPTDAPVYTDLSKSHWAYTAIIEATYDWVKAAEAAEAEDAGADAESGSAESETEAAAE